MRMSLEMWTCKHCGHEVESQFDECSNCGTGINWSPPTKAQAIVETSEAPETLPTSKDPPYSTDSTAILRFLGFAIGIIGLIGGFIVLFNSPDAPSEYSTDALSKIQSANRVVYMVLGWSQIVAGITTGVFLYVVAGIGEAVLDLWKAQQAGK
jgi:hypothetical protein